MWNREDLQLARENRSDDYLGKLRSTNGSNYVLYDHGHAPQGDESDAYGTYAREELRRELCCIHYQPKNRKNPKLRRMQVAIPSLKRNQSFVVWKPLRDSETLEHTLKEVAEAGGQNVVQRNRMTCLHKRETKYDPLSSCIVDFKSRATIVSVKNFQLVHSTPTEKEFAEEYASFYPQHVFEDSATASVPQQFVLMQMGKVGRDCFNVDFQGPLSMLQAFAICLSRFDAKHK